MGGLDAMLFPALAETTRDVPKQYDIDRRENETAGLKRAV